VILKKSTTYTIKECNEKRVKRHEMNTVNSVRNHYILRDMVPLNMLKNLPFSVDASQTTLYRDLFPGSEEFKVADLFDLCPQRSVEYITPEDLLEALDNWKDNWLKYLRSNPSKLCSAQQVEDLWIHIKNKIVHIRNKIVGKQQKFRASAHVDSDSLTDTVKAACPAPSGSINKGRKISETVCHAKPQTSFQAERLAAQLEGQKRQLRETEDENARLVADNARLTADNARLAADNARLAAALSSSDAACRELTVSLERLSRNTAPALDQTLTLATDARARGAATDRGSDSAAARQQLLHGVQVGLR
jgi:hypothetical protein